MRRRDFASSAFLLIALGGVILFAKLGDGPLAMWDESRLAVNAAEMRASGELLVTTFDGAPDLWNTKPPLVVWAQAALLAVLDNPVLAVRLPSAIAALATVLLVLWFAARGLGDTLAGLIAGLVLLSSAAFVGYHAGRSGDYDAALVLWTTLQAIAWYRYLRDGTTRHLALFAAGIALAVWTKGVAGLLLLPGLLLFTVVDGRLVSVLRDGRAWLAVTGALAAAASWYALREAVSPGYVAAVLANEGMRYVDTIEGHTHTWLFFPRRLAAERFVPWALLVPAAWLLLFYVERRLALWAACVGGAFLALIEAAGTKLPWYDLPVFPILALVLGKAGAIVVRHGLALLRPARAALPATAIVATVFALPLAQTTHDVISVSWADDPRLTYGDALRAAGSRRLTVLDGGIENSTGFRHYNAVLRFHAALERANGTDILVVHPGHRFVAGETFLTCDPGALAWAARVYVLSTIGATGQCRTLRIDAESEPAIPVQKQAEAQPWIQDAL